MTPQTRRVKAGQPAPIDFPPACPLPATVDRYLINEAQLHRVDASQLADNDFVFEPPEFKSTPESRQFRASFWLRVVLPIAIVTASVLAALVMAFVK